MAMTDKDDLDLNAFFDAAKAHPEVPSPDLLARVQSDALAHQPIRQAAEVRQPFWRQLLADLGGWPAVAGLATAGVAGVWLGVAPPETLSDTVAALLYGEDVLSVDPLTGFNFALLEG